MVSFDLAEANAVVTQYIFKEIPDALAKANFIWRKLAMDNKQYVSGGREIQFPLKTLANNQLGFINGSTDVIDVNISQQLVYGVLDWKYFYSNVSITLDDITKTNDTPLAIRSLMEAKKELGVTDAVRRLTQAIHGSSVTDPKSFDGLQDAIAATSGTAYAGLVDTDFPDATAYLPVQDTTTAVVNYSNIASMISQIKARLQQDGVSGIDYKLDCAISNDAVYTAFMIAEQAKQRFYENTTLESGFEGIKVNGVFWYVDNFTPGSADGVTADNFLYFLTSKSMCLFYKYGLDKKSPFDGEIRIPNQTIHANQTYLAGNVAVKNRRVNGVFKNLVV